MEVELSRDQQIRKAVEEKNCTAIFGIIFPKYKNKITDTEIMSKAEILTKQMNEAF